MAEASISRVLPDSSFSSKETDITHWEYSMEYPGLCYTTNPKPVISAESILSKLPTFHSQLHPDNHVPLLLVTPAFAPWLEKGHTFLPKLLQHCFRGVVSENVEMCSVEAVVDKLPISVDDTNTLTNGGNNGMEGLSLAIVNWGAISGKLVPQRGMENISPSHTEPKLSISIQNPSTGAEVEVGMPMANTLFTTGRPYTMYASRWNSTECADDVPKMTDRCDLRMCRVGLRTEPKLTLLQTPLHPVTEPRTITESMGNILKTVADEKDPTNDLPASTELEKAIPQYIKEKNLENQRLAVWAMVTPKSIAEAHLESCSDGDVDIPASVKMGSRLYRIMSGGGGWGKKKGLLSLDPEYSYDDQEPLSTLASIHEIFDEDITEKHSADAILFRVLDSAPKLTDFGGNVMSPLREDVTAGDVVQFFVASLDDALGNEAMRSESELLTMARAGKTEGNTQLHFRVLPEPTDAPVPTPATKLSVGEGASPSAEIIVQPNRFGACSEKSMVYSRSGSDAIRASGTKIDVPGARILAEIPCEKPIFRM
ncbi:hypothetical protein FQN49_008601 [Arthroderma sp. PD_2]|nr:hypothetical protein FQN49_008601 [Arthroderma sp. PD_2]